MMKSQIKVSRQQVFAGAISPLIYGEFIEFIDQLIPGMWAEMLRDRSFEGLTPPSVFYRKERDFPQPAWRVLKTLDGRTGEGQRRNFNLTFDLDLVQPFVGLRSACIRVSGGGNFLAGIAQDNLPLSAGETYQLELFLRGAELGGKVHVFIGREYGAYATMYAETVFDGIGQAWQRFAGELHCPASDPAASFAIALDGPGILWVDRVSLEEELAQTLDGRTAFASTVKATLERLPLTASSGLAIDGEADRLLAGMRAADPSGDAGMAGARMWWRRSGLPIQAASALEDLP